MKAVEKDARREIWLQQDGHYLQFLLDYSILSATEVSSPAEKNNVVGPVL
jgi:hypothetical protein